MNGQVNELPLIVTVLHKFPLKVRGHYLTRDPQLKVVTVCIWFYVGDLWLVLQIYLILWPFPLSEDCKESDEQKSEVCDETQEGDEQESEVSSETQERDEQEPEFSEEGDEQESEVWSETQERDQQQLDFSDEGDQEESDGDGTEEADKPEPPDFEFEELLKRAGEGPPSECGYGKVSYMYCIYEFSKLFDVLTKHVYCKISLFVFNR